ncbi:unnamed protein product [Nesidiocoris tenuis]|uniref:RNA-directed DNA polymerase n=1 Tax=Nesidiocoris tenuis TaxID=355587 RepID=A0A6H5GVT8_9HEMI|nr:unnamed protein product [Nesidiocoris tenuis]
MVQQSQQKLYPQHTVENRQQEWQNQQKTFQPNTPPPRQFQQPSTSQQQHHHPHKVQDKSHSQVNKNPNTGAIPKTSTFRQQYPNYAKPFKQTRNPVSSAEESDDSSDESVSEKSDQQPDSTKPAITILQGFPQIFSDFNNSQHQDPAIRKIMDSIRDGTNEETRYQLKKGRLMFESKPGEFKAVVPNELVDVIFRYYHSSVLGSHWGIKRTVQAIKRNFYWPNMFKQIRDRIKSCVNCLENKVERAKPKGELSSSPDTRVGQTLYIDIAGPLPPSYGYQHILICVDGMSRYTVIAPLTRATSDTIINALRQQVFRYFGFRERIVTDNATYFTSKKFTNFLFTCGMKHTRLPPHYPNPNLAERQIQNLKSALRSQCAHDHSKWAQNLYLTQIALNSAYNETTKFSPVELFLGRSLPTPLNFVWDVDEQKLNLPDTWTTAIANIQREHQRNAKNYNRSHTPTTYFTGDHVFVKTYILSDKAKSVNQKLSPKFTSPYTIVKPLSPVTYLIQDTQNCQNTKTVYVSQLKLARQQRS